MTVITPPVTTDTIASAAPFWRLKGFPVIPASILVFIAFVAVFADVLAPYHYNATAPRQARMRGGACAGTRATGGWFRASF